MYKKKKENNVINAFNCHPTSQHLGSDAVRGLVRGTALSFFLEKVLTFINNLIERDNSRDEDGLVLAPRHHALEGALSDGEDVGRDLGQGSILCRKFRGKMIAYGWIGGSLY